MMKIALPLLLAGIVMIAGIFAFMPIDMASTVHTTLQSSSAASTQTTTITTNIQNTQFNNVNSTYDTDLSSNATATCSSGSFLVYWTFSNSTLADVHTTTQLNIDDGVGNDQPDISVILALGNQTSISGVTAGTANEVITFSGGTSFEETGDVMLTVQCQSTATPSLIP